MSRVRRNRYLKTRCCPRGENCKKPESSCVVLGTTNENRVNGSTVRGTPIIEGAGELAEVAVLRPSREKGRISRLRRRVIHHTRVIMKAGTTER